MNREEFIKQKNELLEEQVKISHLIRNLESLYISGSDIARFRMGEKVRVIKRGKTVEGFVVGTYVNYDGYPMLVLKRCKKDGTISKMDLPPYFPECGDRVEKIESE